jgi:hypothetical protein
VFWALNELFVLLASAGVRSEPLNAHVIYACVGLVTFCKDSSGALLTIHWCRNDLRTVFWLGSGLELSINKMCMSDTTEGPYLFCPGFCILAQCTRT